MSAMKALDLAIEQASKSLDECEFLRQEISMILNDEIHPDDASTKSVDIIRMFEHDEGVEILTTESHHEFIVRKVMEEAPEDWCNYAEYPDHEEMRKCQ